jgi:hypothetical protein
MLKIVRSKEADWIVMYAESKPVKQKQSGQ